MTFAPPARECVASFKQSSAADTDFTDRQFSVLDGMDDKDILKEEAEPAEPPQSTAPREEEVVPDIWKKMEKENKEAESKVHEMHAKLQEAERKVEKPAPAGGSDASGFVKALHGWQSNV
eukprot:Skav216410  [mRNA]  locus=scaffold457:481834:493189:+ [translate_table: standard]